MTYLRNRLREEDGIGIVLAISVAFIVFALGATWYSLAIHELEEVSSDRHRTQALNSAEAGARSVMALLAQDKAFRNAADAPGGTNLGITGGACDVVPLTTQVDGVDETQGEYWASVTPLGQRRYEIRSYGWAPRRTSAQVGHQIIEIDVELIPLGGFKDALFAASGGIVGSNRKEIYGTGYSGNDLTLGNFTRFYKNDAPYSGDGSLTVYGDLVIPGGSNVEIRGDVNVQGEAQDPAGSVFLSSIYIRADSAVSSYSSSYFKKSEIAGELKTAGTISSTASFRSISSPPDEGVNNLEDVPQIALPGFVFNEPAYLAAGWSVQHWPNTAALQAYIDANPSDLSGIHVIDGANGNAISFHRTTFTDHFMVIARKNPMAGGSTGSLVVKGTPSGGSTPGGEPATVVIVVDDTAGVLTLGQNFQSIPEEVHHLIFSTGDLDSANQSTVYGAVYGERDISNNRLEIHFRPPEETLIQGAFTFDPALADKFVPSPGLWNDLAPSEAPITAVCAP